jgi:hypothetical protein
MKEMMTALQTCKEAVEAEIAALPQDTPLRLHPGLGAGGTRTRKAPPFS